MNFFSFKPSLHFFFRLVAKAKLLKLTKSLRSSLKNNLNTHMQLINSISLDITEWTFIFCHCSFPRVWCSCLKQLTLRQCAISIMLNQYWCNINFILSAKDKIKYAIHVVSKSSKKLSLLLHTFFFILFTIILLLVSLLWYIATRFTTRYFLLQLKE